MKTDFNPSNAGEQACDGKSLTTGARRLQT
jgi:hypothetical protein